jgi:glycosyltransferase involved in cell wall biosynthesis
MSDPAVSYVVRTLPRLSETFVLRELTALHEQGFPLEIWTLVPGDPAEAARVPEYAAIAPLVRAVPSGIAGMLRMAATLLGLLLRRPLRTGHAIGWALRWSIHDRDPRQIAALPYAAWLATRARGRHFHAHFANTPATTALLAARLSEPTRTASFTGHAKDLYTATSRAFLREKLRRVAFAVVGTGVTERFVRDAAPSGLEVVVARHGVEWTGDHDASRERVEPGLVVGVGRLVEKKGFADLLVAVAAAAGHGASVRMDAGEGSAGRAANRGTEPRDLEDPDDGAKPVRGPAGVRLVLVGDGPLEASLRDEARVLGIEDRVEFLGARSQDEIAVLLTRAAVFALPCVIDAGGDADTFPLAIVEAMRQAVPVLTTTIGEMGLVLEDGVNARVVAPGAPELLGVALRSLLDHPDQAEQLGAAGRALAQRDYDTAKAVQPLIDAFRRVTGEPG